MAEIKIDHLRKHILNRISEKLARIYNEADAKIIHDGILSLVDDTPQHSTAELNISEQDVILICYGDHLQDGKNPPLQVLHAFLRETVHSVINSVHILPFFPYSSDDGFSVIDYTAVDSALGDWHHIDEMKHDFRLMFDAVFNHISAKSDWFQKFLADEAPFTDYFVKVPPDTDLSAVVRPRALPLLTPVETPSGTKHVWTTFSADQIDLNYANPHLMLDMIRILLFYVEHGAEFIRLDAIAFLWKVPGTSSIHLDETHWVIQVMRDVLDLVAPHVVLITETNVPHEENISYFGDGTNEAQMVYQFPLPPLILHTLTSGDSTHLTRWAQSLDPIGERTTFFNFTASHDGIGMRPATGILSDDEVDALVNLATEHGGNVSYKANSDGSQSPYELNITYFDAITHPEITAKNPQHAVDRFMVSQAIQLAFAGVPGIYFHNLFGSRNWNAGVEQTGHNRTINREKLQRSDLETALQNPDSIPALVFSRFQHLLEIRRQQPAMHPLAKQEVISMDKSVVAIQRTALDGQQVMLALHNITGDRLTIHLPEGEWQNLLDNEQYRQAIELKPYQIAWLNRQ